MIDRRSLIAATAALPFARAASAQTARARTLRFMPQAALASLDPVFSPSTIITTHAYCVFDTLYGADRALRPRPQMAEGTMSPRMAGRCASACATGCAGMMASRCARRTASPPSGAGAAAISFGQVLLRATAELSAADDRTIVFRLHRPFPALFDALAKPVPPPAS